MELANWRLLADVAVRSARLARCSSVRVVAPILETKLDQMRSGEAGRLNWIWEMASAFEPSSAPTPGSRRDIRRARRHDREPGGVESPALKLKKSLAGRAAQGDVRRCDAVLTCSAKA